MLNEIHVLQLGDEDWKNIYEIPKEVVLDYVEVASGISKRAYDIVFLDRTPLNEEIELLFENTKAYTLFITERVDVSGSMKWLYRSKKAQYIAADDIQRFLLQEAKYYYPEPYGEKFEPNDISIFHNFGGSIQWNGKFNVELSGDFGKEFKQIAFWRNSIPVFKGQIIDLWLEYRKESDVEILLVVTRFARGSVSEMLERWEFSEKELEQVVHIDGGDKDGFIFAFLKAKGCGKLQIIALHNRYSRGNHGYFLPGGERYVTSDREEIFCYFDPGDLKPPLNVYFDGYRTREGFEGYKLMRSMGCPFLLVSESRLEGGSLHIGSAEFENLMISIIKKCIAELGFLSEEVIMSGVSSGAYAALYYGCDIRPYAMILGKPLTNMGDVAINERYFRPGGFPQSLDILLYLCGDTNDAAIKRLNEKFWDKFDNADWGKSKFIISYMIEDDFDPKAYSTLISHLQSEGAQVYGKGIHGRNNDNTPAVMQWFTSQFRRILEENFARKVKSKW